MDVFPRQDHRSFTVMFVFHPTAISKVSPRTLQLHSFAHLRFPENKLWTFKLTFSILKSTLGCSFTIFSHFTKLQDTTIPLKLQCVNFVQLCKYKE